MKLIKTDEVLESIKAKPYLLVDIRSADEYNGWKISGQKRGGHIPGAKNLPVKWFSYIDWIEIIKEKNILDYEKIIVYGTNLSDLKKAAGILEKAGHTNVRIYENFVEEWLNDKNKRLEKLERYQNLVPPWWVKDVTEGKTPEHLYGKNTVICHVHYRNYDDYLEGHIPGAIPLDTNKIESTESWNRRSPEELEIALTSKGITSESTVILYGRFSNPENESKYPGSNAGQLGAIRAAAIMLYAGVKDVKILNGGLQSWIDEGFDTETKEYNYPVAVNFGSKIPGRPEIMIDTPEAKKLINSENGDIVSIRSRKEWLGEVSGYNYIEKKGHIPGAIFGDCGTDAYHMENYRNLDHTMREFHETEENWKKIGVTRDKKLAFYCGTGWRGSEAFFNAWLMGYPNVSVYDGGWFEWSNDPSNPISTKEID